VCISIFPLSIAKDWILFHVAWTFTVQYYGAHLIMAKCNTVFLLCIRLRGTLLCSILMHVIVFYTLCSAPSRERLATGAGSHGWRSVCATGFSPCAPAPHNAPEDQRLDAVFQARNRRAAVAKM
jgi:hypothetical protein